MSICGSTENLKHWSRKYLEDVHHDFNTVKKLIEEEKIWKESDREVDVIDLSYPVLDRWSDFLSYDWIERADEVIKQEVL